MNLTERNEKLKSRHPHLSLLEYNGYSKNAIFLDADFGEFSGRYDCVWQGSKSHPDRAKLSFKRNSFDKAARVLQQKHKHLVLKSYTAASEVACVIDLDFGEFTGVYNNIKCGKKQHPDRLKAKNFDVRFESLRKHQPHLKLLEYHPLNSKVLDMEFGEFTGAFDKIKSGSVKHPDRVKFEYELSFTAKCAEIAKKFTYLTLVSFDLTSKQAVFHDEEFGEFTANYYKVANEEARHPKRSARNKYQASQRDAVKEKRAQTCLEKYGKRTPLLTLEGVYDFDGSTAKDLYKNANLDVSYIKFLRLIKHVGIDNALKAAPLKTDIEMIIEQRLQNLKIGYVFNSSLAGCRPDFVLPKHNLVIEADGLLYHSDAVQSDKSYHLKKQQKYLEQGYDSLFFRGDEIKYKSEIVASMIAHKAGVTKDVVYARKCSIHKSNSKLFRQWFDDNHIMGNGSGTVYFLEYNGSVVSAISVVNKKKYLEISRFCNKINTVSVGGFGKLLKHAIKEFQPKTVMSFVDSRYGNGHSLIKNGFVQVSNYLSFKWTDYTRTYHRMKYPGNSGYDHGMAKIWDCGQRKFVLQLER